MAEITTTKQNPSVNILKLFTKEKIIMTKQSKNEEKPRVECKAGQVNETSAKFT
jgi:hypothetical protein